MSHAGGMMGAMAARANAFNTTHAPVVIDGEGHRLDGKSSGKVDPDLPEVAAGVLSGALLVSETITERIEEQAEAEPAPDEAPAAVVDAPAPAPAGSTARQKGTRA